MRKKFFYCTQHLTRTGNVVISRLQMTPCKIIAGLGIAESWMTTSPTFIGEIGGYTGHPLTVYEMTQLCQQLEKNACHARPQAQRLGETRGFASVNNGQVRYPLYIYIYICSLRPAQSGRSPGDRLLLSSLMFFFFCDSKDRPVHVAPCLLSKTGEHSVHCCGTGGHLLRQVILPEST